MIYFFDEMVLVLDEIAGCVSVSNSQSVIEIKVNNQSIIQCLVIISSLVVAQSDEKNK